MSAPLRSLARLRDWMIRRLPHEHVDPQTEERSYHAHATNAGYETTRPAPRGSGHPWYCEAEDLDHAEAVGARWDV
jgi:hypothetical protein